MYRLAGVFFKVGTRDADALFTAISIVNCQFAVFDDRKFVLADLVTLRQVGIEIVLARKH